MFGTLVLSLQTAIDNLPFLTMSNIIRCPVALNLRNCFGIFLKILSNSFPISQRILKYSLDPLEFTLIFLWNGNLALLFTNLINVLHSSSFSSANFFDV
jgi:hypothetical protein